MKNFYLLLFSSLISTSIFGQDVFVNQETRTSRILDLEYISDSVYIQALVDSKDDSGFGRIQWVENEKVIKTISVQDDCKSLDLRTEEDQIFVDISSITLGCDVVFPRFNTVNLSTFEGDVISTLGGEVPEFKKAQYFKDSTFLLLDGFAFEGDAVAIKVFDNENLLLKDIALNTAGINDLVVINEKIIVFGGENILLFEDADNSIISLNYEGETVLDIESAGPEALYIMTNQGIYFQDYVRDERFLTTFNVEDFTPIDLEYLPVPSFAPMFNVLGEKSDGSQIMLTYSDTGWFVSEDLFHPNTKMNKLFELNKELAITGNVFIEAKPDMLGPSVIQRPSLIDYLVDEVSVDFVAANKIENDTKMVIQVSVTNNSGRALEDVKVYSNTAWQGHCYEEFFNSEASLLEISETVILTDTLIIASNTPFDDMLCFFAAGSDRIFDPAFQNNVSCGLTLDALDVNTEDPKVTISPNPVETLLTVKSEGIVKSYEIFDLNGKRISFGKYQGEISVVDFSAGIYLITLEAEEGKKVTEKFVKM